MQPPGPKPTTRISATLARPIATKPDDDEPAVGPLTEADYRALRASLAARRAVRNAARTASLSAGIILAIGLAGLPVAVIYPTWTSLLMVVAIIAIGVVERAGARRLRRGQASAAGLLACNQLAFLSLIVLYCLTRAVSAAQFHGGGGLLSAQLGSQLSRLPELGQDLQQQLDFWTPLATYGFYGLIIVLSLAFQGGLAAYYFTRRRHLLAFRQQTPQWIQRLLAELGL